MHILWENEPVSSTELSKICYESLSWKKSTTFNMIKKLSQKNIIKNQDAVVTSLVTKEQIQKAESEDIIEKKFNGSLPSFLAAFLVDKKLKESEFEEIIKIIEEAK